MNETGMSFADASKYIKQNDINYSQTWTVVKCDTYLCVYTNIELCKNLQIKKFQVIYQV